MLQEAKKPLELIYNKTYFAAFYHLTGDYIIQYNLRDYNKIKLNKKGL